MYTWLKPVISDTREVKRISWKKKSHELQLFINCFTATQRFFDDVVGFCADFPTWVTLWYSYFHYQRCVVFIVYRFAS